MLNNNQTAEAIGKELAAEEKALISRCDEFLVEINKIVYEPVFFSQQTVASLATIDEFTTNLEESFQPSDLNEKVKKYKELLSKKIPMGVDNEKMLRFLNELERTKEKIDKLQEKLHDINASSKVVSNRVATQPVQAAKVVDDPNYPNLIEKLDKDVRALKILEKELAKPFPKRVYKEIKNTFLSAFSNQPHNSKHDLVKSLREGLESIKFKQASIHTRKEPKPRASELNEEILSKFEKFDENRKNRVVFSTAGEETFFSKIDKMKHEYLQQSSLKKEVTPPTDKHKHKKNN